MVELLLLNQLLVFLKTSSCSSIDPHSPDTEAFLAEKKSNRYLSSPLTIATAVDSIFVACVRAVVLYFLSLQFIIPKKKAVAVSTWNDYDSEDTFDGNALYWSYFLYDRNSIAVFNTIVMRFCLYDYICATFVYCSFLYHCYAFLSL